MTSLQSIQALIEAIREHNAIFSRKDPIPLREAAWNDMARAALYAEVSLRQLLADNSWVQQIPKGTFGSTGHEAAELSSVKFLRDYISTLPHTEAVADCTRCQLNYLITRFIDKDRTLSALAAIAIPSAPETTEEGK